MPLRSIRDPSQTDADRDFRGYASRVAGVFKVGDEVVALPSGLSSTVTSIAIGDKQVEKAFRRRWS